MTSGLALYLFAMVAIVVGVDVLFFRNLFWARLMVNVGIVLERASVGSIKNCSADRGLI